MTNLIDRDALLEKVDAMLGRMAPELKEFGQGVRYGTEQTRTLIVSAPGIVPTHGAYVPSSSKSGFTVPVSQTIEDGFGSVWSKRCCVCHELTMEVVRPGKVQCNNCDGLQANLKQEKGEKK